MLLFDRIRKYCLSSAWNIGFVEDKVQCVILNDFAEYTLDEASI